MKIGESKPINAEYSTKFQYFYYHNVLNVFLLSNINLYFIVFQNGECFCKSVQKFVWQKGDENTYGRIGCSW